MKKILIAIICSLFVFTSNAQNTSELNDTTKTHLKFRNIEIDGNVEIFIQELKKIGFTYVQKAKDNLHIMEGEFTGENCKLFISCTPKTKITSRVTAFLKESKSWTSIKSAYNSYKELFSKKYGEPQSFEFFKKPYYEGDGYELQAIKNDKCTYMSIWKTKNGIISIGISTTIEIVIDYGDKINSEKAEKEQDEEILDEI